MNKLHKGIYNGLWMSFILWAVIILALSGCGKILTPMPENQIAPYIFMEKKNAVDNYITNYCDARA